MKDLRKAFIFIFLLLPTVVLAQKKESVLWKISGNALPEKSYLFGTFHTVSYMLVDSFPELKNIMRKCDFGLFEKGGHYIGNVQDTVERNFIWLPKIMAKMKEGSCFIAVGLEHLQYKTGLIQLLRQKGYKLEPVKLKKCVICTLRVVGKTIKKVSKWRNAQYTDKLCLPPNRFGLK